ncbi:hypothetical protein [Celeribacter baekdonensis]|uniref:hypothetical protein n=1 Tax=Celeribacter baekdonensis TaxID=875171 RepID=UPI003A8F8DC5
MLGLILMGLIGSYATYSIVENLLDDDNGHDGSDDEAGTPDDTSGEDGDLLEDDEETDEDTDWEWSEDHLITEDTTLSLSQDELDVLLAQSATGDVPLLTLEDNATLTIDVEGETAGYLHAVSYTKIIEGTDGAEDLSEVHTMLVWSESADAPELLGDETAPGPNPDDTFYTDQDLSSEDLIGDTGTVLMDVKLYSATSEFLDYSDTGPATTGPYAVQDAGRLVLEDTDFDTFSAALNDPSYLADTTYAMDWASEPTNSSSDGAYTLTSADITYLTETDDTIAIDQFPGGVFHLDISGEVDGYFHAVQSETINADGSQSFMTDIYLTDTTDVPSDFEALDPILSVSGGFTELHPLHDGVFFSYLAEVNLDADSFASVTTSVIDNRPS